MSLRQEGKDNQDCGVSRKSREGVRNHCHGKRTRRAEAPWKAPPLACQAAPLRAPPDFAPGMDRLAERSAKSTPMQKPWRRLLHGVCQDGCLRRVMDHNHFPGKKRREERRRPGRRRLACQAAPLRAPPDFAPGMDRLAKRSAKPTPMQKPWRRLLHRSRQDGRLRWGDGSQSLPGRKNAVRRLRNLNDIPVKSPPDQRMNTFQHDHQKINHFYPFNLVGRDEIEMLKLSM